jgi:hypothetical protein
LRGNALAGLGRRLRDAKDDQEHWYEDPHLFTSSLRNTSPMESASGSRMLKP